MNPASHSLSGGSSPPRASRPARLASLLVIPLAMAALWLLPGTVAAQSIGSPEAGPVIDPWGAVFKVEGLEVPVDTEREYRVVFDVAESPAGTDGVNPNLNTVARFLNMHARAGVPTAKMHVAVVLHGTAAKDGLLEEPYRTRYQATNPNADLLRQLAGAGVELYICGQSAMSRNLPDHELLPEIRMALSAMTIRADLQAAGFQVVN